jgi:hypothetical protein
MRFSSIEPPNADHTIVTGDRRDFAGLVQCKGRPMVARPKRRQCSERARSGGRVPGREAACRWRLGVRVGAASHSAQLGVLGEPLQLARRRSVQRDDDGAVAVPDREDESAGGVERQGVPHRTLAHVERSHFASVVPRDGPEAQAPIVPHRGEAGIARSADASGGVGSCRMAARVAVAVSRRNGCWPVSSSCSTTPNANTSVRGSTGSPCTCSGAR